MKTPNFETYGNYSSQNYGAHAIVFTDPNGDLFYFSYKTLVAFSHNGKLTIRENAWGPTTGKHLNAINPDHSIRVSEEEFNRIYNETFPQS